MARSMSSAKLLEVCEAKVSEGLFDIFQQLDKVFAYHVKVRAAAVDGVLPGSGGGGAEVDFRN